MISFLVKRPIGVGMLFFALVILGFVSYKQLPISLLPDVNIPIITVEFSNNDFTARDFDNNFIKPARRLLGQCAGIESLRSETKDGYSSIRLKFNFNTDIDYAALEVNEKIDLLMDDYLNQINRPKVIKASATDIPVFFLNISIKDSYSSERFLNLSRVAKHVIRKRIEQLSEIAMVDVSGIDAPVISIKPDFGLMRSLGLTHDDIEDYFYSNNFNAGNIVVKDGHYHYNIRFSNEMRSIDAIKNIYIEAGSKVLQLKDIAEVKLVAAKRNGRFMFNNERAISMAIIKQADVKMQDLNESIERTIKSLKLEYPNLSFDITQDQTKLLKYSINNLKSTLVLGGILAFVIIVVFMWNFRLPLLMGVSIPISVLISMLFLNLLNISINIISLSGLVLGIGMMIDNSIIVIENITQLRERGYDVFQAAVTGVNDIIRPLLSSALTTSAVFIPLIFLSGVSGALFYDQAITVTIGLGVSFIVSITILPTLYYLLHKKQKKYLVPKRTSKVFERIYKRSFNFLFENKRISVVGFLCIIVFSCLLIFNVKKQTFPDLPESELLVNINWNENITIDLAEKRIADLIIKLDGHYKTTCSWIGNQDFVFTREINLSTNEAALYFDVISKAHLKTLKELIDLFLTKNYPNCIYKCNAPENVFTKTFADNEAPFVLNLHYDNAVQGFEQIAQFSKELNNNLEIPSEKKISKMNYMALSFNPEKLLIQDVNTVDLFNTLKIALNENKIGFLRTTGEVLPVYFMNKSVNLRGILEQTFVKNKNGIELPISSFISWGNKEDFQTIEASEEGRIVTFRFDVESSQLPELKGKIEDFLSIKYPNFNFYFSGSLLSFTKNIKEMIVVMVVSILLLYFILSAQFESITQPLIILLEIPIDIAGSVILLMLMGNSLNIMSCIGIVVMSGIIINDSILKVDTINHLYREQRYNLKDAIYEAGKRRLRPILMTSLTTIFALLPFLFSSSFGATLQKPLALTIIGGLSLGTIVSVYFVPLMYYLLNRNSVDEQK